MREGIRLGDVPGLLADDRSQLQLVVELLGSGWMYIPMKSAPIPKQSGKHAEQIGSPGSRSEATLGFCS
jgi:hypothetical protein